MHILCPHCKNPIEVVKITAREEIACPSCGSSFHVETGSTTGWQREAGQRLGKFELIDVLGQGAFGTVYKARDPELDRTVAVKVPRAGNLAGPQELDRFLREARSAAQLRHPSIVTVHDVGQADGVPYLVSDFVQGVTLTDVLSARRPGFRESAELVAAVADALQYAHERGVVHRDVKPSNIMIGDDGAPHVMDFGLAKRDAGEITMTVEGQILGTPAYMPPEQARGEGHAVDARGDVYSLGVVLYQLLTGELPFRGTSRMLLHQVLHDEPRPPRSLNDHIPRDLETVTLKAMAKEPARRYASARDMADDLRRWLRGEPIQARPVGRVERAVRWARRRPATAALLGVSGVALLALVGLAVGVVYHARLSEAYEREALARGEAEEARLAEEEQRKKAEAATLGEEKERKKAQAALKRAEEVGYYHSVFLADLALREGQVSLAQRHLKECKPELRGWEWRYLNAQCQTELFSLPGATVRFSPDGTRVAVWGSRAGSVVRIYDARTGAEALSLKGPGLYNSPAFSPDGTRLAVIGDAGVVKIYDARRGAEAHSLKGPPSRGRPEYSPDGTRLTVWGKDGVVRIYNARTGAEVFSLKAEGQPFSLVYSPDGTRLAVGSDAGVVRIYNARTGAEVFSLKAEGQPFSLVYSPDGTRLAVGSFDGVLKIYDARTGAEALSLKAAGRLATPAFSPDGTRLAVSGDAGVVRIFDARTGAEAFSLKATAKNVLSPAAVYSPDGTRLAVRGIDGAVRLYDARTASEILSFKGSGLFFSPAFSPDGTRLAVSGDAGVVRIYDVRTGAEALSLKGLGMAIPVYSPDGTRLAVWGNDGVVRIYDARTGAEALSLKSAMYPVFSPDGTRLAVRGNDGVVRIYDAPIDAAAWQAERRKDLADTFPAWHRAEAAEAERANLWFAAAFHRRWLARLEPANGPAYFRLGLALARLGRTAEAKAAFEKALALREGLSELDQADAMVMLGKWDEASRLFDKAMTATNADASSGYNHAFLRLEQGYDDGYRKACQTLIARFGKSTDASVANSVAWACAVLPDALPDLKPAVELARAAVRANSKDPNVRNTLGAILHRAGQFKEAVAELNTAIKLSATGGTPADFLFLAMAHHKLNQAEEARKWLKLAREALEKSPPAPWTDQVTYRHLCGEAERLIHGATPNK